MGDVHYPATLAAAAAAAEVTNSPCTTLPRWLNRRHVSSDFTDSLGPKPSHAVVHTRSSYIHQSPG
jgi:hypothetical protein